MTAFLLTAVSVLVSLTGVFLVSLIVIEGFRDELLQRAQLPIPKGETSTAVNVMLWGLAVVCAWYVLGYFLALLVGFGVWVCMRESMKAWLTARAAGVVNWVGNTL